MMLALENADEILQILDRFTKQKSKDIPPELEEYINYVAKTGDTVYRWPTVQYLFREKLRNVIKDFHDTTASIEDLPQCPNVDRFNYDSMKTLLFERFDNFQAAPFTIQRLCELLTDPKKHYSRLDKFMRALEKNILVVSTVEPGRKPLETDENGDISINGDILHDINIDVEMNKTDDKLPTNGTTEKPAESNANKHIAEEIASSSGISQVTGGAEAKKDDVPKVDEPVAEQSSEQPKDTIKIESQASTDEKPEAVSSTPEKAVEAEAVRPTDSSVAVESTNSELKVAEEKVEKIENVPIDAQVKAESIETEAVAKIEEKKLDEKPHDITSEAIASERPPTPKHARSTSDDEDDDAVDGTSAKKIRLELDENIEPKLDLEPSIEPLGADVEDLQKEADILDSLSTEIDAQKESELLNEVVDSTLADDKNPINVDIQPISENIVDEVVNAAKPIEAPESVVAEDLLKTDQPVAIPSDLDFTPDEALNELVSSEILAVIPEQPAEEVKMSDEPANTAEPVAAADEMNVENTEANNLEIENAMESAPIKGDEEQMDVDESNSVDAMDL